MDPHSTNPCIVDTNESFRGKVIIVNPQGLHMRPAMAFARKAQGFESTVTVQIGDRSVNGKSLIDLMLLAAEAGTELIVEVQGSDAPKALPELLEILGAPSAEDLES